ncbi:hypothetical protein COO60DRAFT_1287464 [Scenedesmus sp. NREL 46B-D3]|nr:hypothetical protein COO60DRAFT_1287464 [Scenedesmus sp. NREL 46B-D3]
MPHQLRTPCAAHCWTTSSPALSLSCCCSTCAATRPWCSVQRWLDRWRQAPPAERAGCQPCWRQVHHCRQHRGRGQVRAVHRWCPD